MGDIVRDVCGTRTRVTGAVALLLLCAVAATAAMQIASTTIGVPEDDQSVLLAGLAYPGAGWTVEFTSVRVHIDSEQDVDPAIVMWTMSATSSRPMVQKVIIELFVEDRAGKKLKSVKKFVVVKSNAEKQEIPIKMKIKRADWERAHKVRIKTTFTVL